MEKIKNNLHIMFKTDVYSYTTKVAVIKDDHIQQLGYWSKTTQGHINYIGRLYSKEVRYEN